MTNKRTSMIFSPHSLGAIFLGEKTDTWTEPENWGRWVKTRQVAAILLAETKTAEMMNTKAKIPILIHPGMYLQAA